MGRGLLGDGIGASLVDVAAIFDSDFPKCVAELVDMGILVAIGTTRDRGALSVTITNDGEWDREYFRDSMDAVDWLRRATVILRGRGLGQPETDVPPVQKPTRRRQKLT